MIEKLKPAREKYTQLMQDKAFLDKQLRAGAERAQARARVTIDNVYKTVGLVARR